MSVRFAHFRARLRCALQNKVPIGQLRAVGAPIAITVTERLVDLAARARGEDALEFRRRNLLRPGEPVRPDGTGKPLDADLIGDVENGATAVTTIGGCGRCKGFAMKPCPISAISVRSTEMFQYLPLML